MTAACWERMQPWFESRGYRTLAPNWPGKDRPVEQIRADPSPPKGVWPFEPTALRSLFGALTRYLLGRRVGRWSFGSFRYAFVHLLPLDEAKAAYDRHVVPETGRIFFQSAMALLHPRSPTRVDFRNGTRAPLLIIAGGSDRIVPPVINHRNHRAFARSRARTDFREFAGRTHWIIAQDGWDEVAEHIDGWLRELNLTGDANWTSGQTTGDVISNAPDRM